MYFKRLPNVCNHDICITLLGILCYKLHQLKTFVGSALAQLIEHATSNPEVSGSILERDVLR